MSSNPPTTLGQYQIIREIARSNDIVYEAYDPLMNRRVAIKELSVPSGTTEPQKAERVSRFRREAQAAGTLNHPNIMTVYSFAEDAGRHFMALEFLDGCTLRNELDTKGSCSLERALELIQQVLEGLGHAHSKGVIHRDIKPDNIQILANGQVKITDFGIARLTFQPNLTMDGQVFGTPSYMSPEQVVGREIDARSDLFSVGVVLYEMLTGTKPFSGDSVVSITYAIMNTEPAAPQNIPYPVWQVIQRAIEKSSAMRYRDAASFLQALLTASQRSDPQLTPDPGPQFGPNYVYGHAPAQPSVVYPYNPYAAQPSPPIVPPPVIQAPGPIPFPTPQPSHAYYTQAPPYHPPPRAPLFKPETVVFFKKVLVTTLLLGTLFTLVVVGVMELVKALERRQLETKDRTRLAQVLEPSSQMSAAERIRELQEIRNRMESESMRAQLDQQLAAIYELRGKELRRQRLYAEAEAAFKEAIALDRSNALLLSNLADLYQNRASAQVDPRLRSTLFLSAGQNWAAAYSMSTDGVMQQRYAEAAAACLVLYADDVLRHQVGTAAEARNALYEARAIAQAGTQLRSRIDQMLATIR